LIFCREKEHFNNSIMNYLSDEVYVYFNVLVALMLKWIFVELDGTLIVAPEGGRILLLEYKL
jgi:hypothetical protein